MTGSWLIVKWLVVGAAGLSVAAGGIVWMIEGNKFVCEKPGQGIFLALGIAGFLSVGLASRLCFALAGVIYAWVAIVLLRELARSLRFC